MECSIEGESRMKVLASDYDDTLATEGRISKAAMAALEQFRAEGNQVILVTGRILEDFYQVCPEVRVFDWIVAENGALLHHVHTQKTELLCDPISKREEQRLRATGIQDLESGHVILSTSRHHLEKIDDWRVSVASQVQVILNRQSVMILPFGVDKLTGLTHALRQIHYPITEVVGFGDAENDLSFLSHCKERVAVQNAIESVKKIATYVTQAQAGDGVAEFLQYYDLSQKNLRA